MLWSDLAQLHSQSALCWRVSFLESTRRNPCTSPPRHTGLNVLLSDSRRWGRRQRRLHPRPSQKEFGSFRRPFPGPLSVSSGNAVCSPNRLPVQSHWLSQPCSWEYHPDEETQRITETVISTACPFCSFIPILTVHIKLPQQWEARFPWNPPDLYAVSIKAQSTLWCLYYGNWPQRLCSHWDPFLRS